jgi:hypothetical protein
VARNTDDRQVWAPPGDQDAPGWDIYHYDDGTAALQDADGSMAASPRRDAGRVLRLFALVGAVVGLAGLTAAACVLSYSSMHHLATQAGVSARLASVYPLIFDALLVVTGCSVLALRGAGLVSRVYGWLCMLVLLGCLAAGGAVRAAAVNVPRHLAGVVAAIVPWALVLIGFGLLLALLRYARIRRTQGPGQAAQHDPASSAPATAGDGYEPGAVTESASFGYSEPAVSTAAENEPSASAGPPPVQASELNPAPTSDDEAGQVPSLRRTRSSPTPPGE